MQTAPDASPPSIETRAWRLTLLMVGGLTIVRLAALFLTPLELYPDEAQYWLWSRELAFGYFSKPPMIAWLIWLTTTLGGDAEAWVRLSAPLLHGATALVVYRIAQRLYGGWTGLAAAAIYSLMPGVVLSSGLMATDAPFAVLPVPDDLGLCRAPRRGAKAARAGRGRTGRRAGPGVSVEIRGDLCARQHRPALSGLQGRAATLEPSDRRRFPIGLRPGPRAEPRLERQPPVFDRQAHGRQRQLERPATLQFPGTDRVRGLAVRCIRPPALRRAGRRRALARR